MRRIIFGAIWLTGFLAVLLSWGMLWGRTQGDGPNRMIGVAGDNLGCHLYVVVIESGAYRPVGPLLPSCRVLPIGWSLNGRWFYFQFDNSLSQTPMETQVARIDQNLRHFEIILEKEYQVIFGGWNSNFLEYPTTVEMPQKVYRLSTSRGGYDEISSSISMDAAVRVSSPTGESLIVFDLTSMRGWNNYVGRGDGIYVEPEINNEYLSRTWATVLASNVPEWLVLVDTESMDGNQFDTKIYKVRPDGSDWSWIAWDVEGPTYSGWVHQSGLLGLLENNVFSAMWVDTGEIIWTLDGVEKVYASREWDDPKTLDRDWVHFKMTDGRLARCRFDGSDLTFYDPQNFSVYRVWGWTPDGEWVWFETDAANPNLVDIVRVQANTGKPELMVDETYWGQFAGWSPDRKWAYYLDDYFRLNRVRMDGTSQSEIVLRDSPIFPITWTPPYQAEWQPTHTLAIGIGLMSFSTLTPILLCRRKRKPRPA